MGGQERRKLVSESFCLTPVMAGIWSRPDNNADAHYSWALCCFSAETDCREMVKRIIAAHVRTP